MIGLDNIKKYNSVRRKTDFTKLCILTENQTKYPLNIKITRNFDEQYC